MSWAELIAAKWETISAERLLSFTLAMACAGYLYRRFLTWHKGTITPEEIAEDDEDRRRW